MKKLFLLPALILAINVHAQTKKYSTAQAHSHNDYERNTPFYEAASLHFGSIEADIHLKDGVLYVAHDHKDIQAFRTFKEMYLLPVVRQFTVNNGKAYTDGTPMQLLVDVKTEGRSTVKALQELLLPYRQYFDRSVNPEAVKIVLSGNVPPAAEWDQYDKLFFFDGRPDSTYPASLKPRIAMVSTDFGRYTQWNGKGTLTPADLKKVQQVINSAHAQGYAFRFWGTPSSKSSYYKLMDLGVDIIGTDKPTELYDVISNTAKTSVAGLPVHETYTPTYASDATQVRSKNVILMIGDGTGLAQMFAGYTANKGALSLFKMKQLGLSKTQSADNYHTDSAAGGSAMGTGSKTNNREIGMDKTYVSIPVLSETLAPKGIQSGVVVTEEITGATPASFYGHTTDRDSTRLLAQELGNSPIQLAVGGGREEFNRDLGAQWQQELTAKGVYVLDNLDNWNVQTKKRTLVILSNKAVGAMQQGRGDYLKRAVKKALQQLNASGKGFFLMIEGSRIDHGGHFNDLDYLVREMLDFDEAIGEALRFADQDKQTTVIVTADHETSGLSLMDGDIATGQLRGHFATNDHTGIPVMVFAYGPNSQLFRGVYENNEIYEKMLRCFGIKK